MTANEVIILIMFIAITVAVGVFLAVFIIEHFSGHSVYGRQQIQIHIQDGEVNGKEIVMIREGVKKKDEEGKPVNNEYVITAKELLLLIDLINERGKKKKSTTPPPEK